jgi:hypothetical protein
MSERRRQFIQAMANANATLPADRTQMAGSRGRQRPVQDVNAASASRGPQLIGLLEKFIRTRGLGCAIG